MILRNIIWKKFRGGAPGAPHSKFALGTRELIQPSSPVDAIIFTTYFYKYICPHLSQPCCTLQSSKVLLRLWSGNIPLGWMPSIVVQWWKNPNRIAALPRHFDDGCTYNHRPVHPDGNGGKPTDIGHLTQPTPEQNGWYFAEVIFRKQFPETHFA